MKTAELLTQRLELVYRWYGGMVNPDTRMFEYLYIPQADTFVHEKSPIRDIASVWDVEILSDFLNRHELLLLVEKSLQHYGDYLVERDGYLILDPGRLEEPSAHCPQRLYDPGPAARPAAPQDPADRRPRRGDTPAAEAKRLVQGVLPRPAGQGRGTVCRRGHARPSGNLPAVTGHPLPAKRGTRLLPL